MVVESSSMATRFGEDEDVEVELELRLSLGGPFKKTEKSKPTEIRTDGQVNAVRFAKDVGVHIDGGTTKREINATRRKETRMKRELRRGEEGECKRIKTECSGILNGVTNGVDLDLSFSKNGSGQFKENNKAVTIGSPICSSSDVSDPSSSSRHEGMYTTNLILFFVKRRYITIYLPYGVLELVKL